MNKSVKQRKLHGEKDERRRRREASGYCISQGWLGLLPNGWTVKNLYPSEVKEVRKDKDEEWTCVADDSGGCEASVRWRWHTCIKPIRETHLSAYWSRLNIWMWHSSKRTSLLSNQNGEAGVYSGGMSLVSMVHSFAQHEGWLVTIVSIGGGLWFRLVWGLSRCVYRGFRFK